MEADEGIEGRLCEKVAWRKTGMGGKRQERSLDWAEISF